MSSSNQLRSDEALATLQAHKDAWVALGIPERIVLLDTILRDVMRVAERWVAASLRAKGIPARSLGVAEEWLFLATVVRAVRLIRQSLRDIQRHGRPCIAGPITHAATGQIVARVFPQDHWDRLVFRGITGEVWMEPGVTAEAMIHAQALAYRDKRHGGRVALVLGAGNASMLPVVDILHKLFVEDQVVLLKPNPVNAYLGPLIEEAFYALTSRGFLRISYGDSAEGAFLCNHSAVDELHLTGSAQTFEAITFGPGLEGNKRKRARQPLITKRFSCELGNISPVIIVPGPWSAGDVNEQAEQIATSMVANAGYGCLTPRLIIQHKTWPLRNVFIDALGRVLSQVATRDAYYPGTEQLYAAFLAAHPAARRFGRPAGNQLPWTVIADVDPHIPNEICFTHEAFCSICAETSLEAADAAEFIDRAVDFANSTLWGTLNATLIVHPKSLQDPRVSAALDRGIAQLHYGAVLVNSAAFAAYYLLVTPWGGFPGHDIYDIQSGTGKTANFLMFEQAQKSVVRAPFTKYFDPIRVTSQRAHEFSRKLAYFEASHSFWGMSGLIRTALRTTAP